MSDCQRSLTEDEKKELDGLNRKVTIALENRKIWLDGKMHETSRLQVGDDIYGWKYSGGGERKLGVVSRLYRYHADRNDLSDDSHWCSYEYETSPNSFDNTSRQNGVCFGTREDAIKNADQRAYVLRNNL